MWFHRTQNKQATLFLVIDDNQAALITWDNDLRSNGHDRNRNNHATHPFVVRSYTALPTEWFLHGVPWHVSSFTTYLQSYVQQHTLKKPLLVCACNGTTTYEKTVSLAHMPTQAVIPPDKNYTHYAWHASSLPTPQELSPAHTHHTTTFELPTQLQDPSLNMSYLVSGMPHSDILRLRLCADKSGCVLHRMTTIRASMQSLYLYCQQHGITPEITHATENLQNTETSHDTLLDMLCAPLPETHNRRLVFSALGLSLFERNNV